MFHQIALHAVGGVIKTGAFALLAAVDFHHPRAVYGFVQHLGHHAHLLLVLARQAAQPLADDAHAQTDHRQGNKRNQGQAPIKIQQQTEQANYAHAVFGQHRNHTEAGIGDLVGIVQNARHHAPAGVFAEITGRQPQQLGKHFVAHPLHQMAGQIAGGVFVDKIE